MAKIHFAAPEGASSIGRNRTYPVKNGVFSVEDPDDVQAFLDQGYRQVPAPAPGGGGRGAQGSDKSQTTDKPPAAADPAKDATGAGGTQPGGQGTGGEGGAGGQTTTVDDQDKT